MSAIVKEVMIGNARLILGDARTVQDVAADMICCDPPYLLTSGGNATGEMQGKFAKDKYDNSGRFVECNITWVEIWQVFKSSLTKTNRAHIYCMMNNRNVREAWVEAETAGFYFHNLLVWNKGTPTPNRWYMKNLEYILMFKHGPAFHINDCAQSQLINFPPTKETIHPTEKPVELMANYIRQSTQPGQLVYDPFMGCGATIVAAIREGRSAVGVEINPEYFEVACDRVRAACERGPSLFEQDSNRVQEALL